MEKKEQRKSYSKNYFRMHFTSMLLQEWPQHKNRTFVNVFLYTKAKHSEAKIAKPK